MRIARHADPKQRKAPVRTISIDAARFEASKPIEVGGRGESIEAQALGPVGLGIVGIFRREGQCDGL